MDRSQGTGRRRYELTVMPAPPAPAHMSAYSSERRWRHRPVGSACVRMDAGYERDDEPAEFEKRGGVDLAAGAEERQQPDPAVEAIIGYSILIRSTAS